MPKLTPPETQKADKTFERGKAAFDREDYKTAIQLWQPLAESGHPAAQNWLGVMYEWGNFLKKDSKEAIKWYRKAALQRDVGGQFNLGFCYEAGIGVRKNDAKAFSWYLRAANQGDPEAQWRIARKYWHGEGVKKNLVQAYKWDLISEKSTGWNRWMVSGHEDLPTRNLTKQMTAKQRAEAKRLARLWKPSPLSSFRLRVETKTSE